MNAPQAPIAVGAVIRVSEPDYMYGLGDLILRVTALGGVRHHHGDAWLNVQGVQLRSNGVEVGERFALVRLAALGAQSVSAAAARSRTS